MVAYLMPYKVLAVGLSDVGLVRQNNEDVWTVLPEIGFYVLADGMGGHQAGEIAAQEGVRLLCRVISKKINVFKEESPISDFGDLVYKAILHVNAAIFKMGRARQKLRGMGTTICCMLFHPKGIILAHVGDSRIYRLRGNALKQLTKDHSLLRELLDQGQIEEDQASDFLYKNIITKAIGTEPKVKPSVEVIDVMLNDTYLMCSDGLSDLLTDNEIESILNESISLQDAAEVLVACANEKGGRDNITVVITKIVGSNDIEDISR